jgi:hypothetical protein
MKTTRLILMVLAAPAAILLGLHEVAGSPIFKGYDAGFSWHVDPSRGFVLSVDADGNMSCWLLLKTSAKSGAFTAATSAGTPLRVYRDHLEGDDQWIAIVKEGGTPQAAFEWPAGGTLFLRPQNLPQTDLDFGDWYVYLSNKSYDSRKRSRWRKVGVLVSWPLLALSLCGVILEAIDRVREKARKTEPLTPQMCLQQLIRSVDGENEQQAQEMQTVLGQVLIHGVSARDALAVLPLTPVQKAKFWFKTTSQFRGRLQYMIDELDRYLARLLARL